MTAHLPTKDLLQLRYLARNGPLWGGHLQRGEPNTDPDLDRWLECGLIKAVDRTGYILTEKGEQTIASPTRT